mmetsp:Transcript_7660/g.23574  ORF Transcript_7660/g.23574 Transcript_7660/m.23574 type:complete len:380 (-) Transcript_7660:753-1892(-)
MEVSSKRSSSSSTRTPEQTLSSCIDLAATASTASQLSIERSNSGGRRCPCTNEGPVGKEARALGSESVQFCGQSLSDTLESREESVLPDFFFVDGAAAAGSWSLAPSSEAQLLGELVAGASDSVGGEASAAMAAESEFVGAGVASDSDTISSAPQSTGAAVAESSTVLEALSVELASPPATRAPSLPAWVSPLRACASPVATCASLESLAAPSSAACALFSSVREAFSCCARTQSSWAASTRTSAGYSSSHSAGGPAQSHLRSSSNRAGVPASARTSELRSVRSIRSRTSDAAAAATPPSTRRIRNTSAFRCVAGQAEASPAASTAPSRPHSSPSSGAVSRWCGARCAADSSTARRSTSSGPDVDEASGAVRGRALRSV